MKSGNTTHLSRSRLRRHWLAPLIIAMFLGSLAQAAPAVTTQGLNEGRPPQRQDLSPAQQRLMARRAAEVRALRDAVQKGLGVPRPDQIGTGTIEIQGRIASYRVLESRELPDGRWRVLVEVTLTGPWRAQARSQPTDRAGAVLTDYLTFRAGLIRSRQECLGQEARLEQELTEAAESIRQAITQRLRSCRADLIVIDHALSQLEGKTLERLSVATSGAASAPSE